MSDTDSALEALRKAQEAYDKHTAIGALSNKTIRAASNQPWSQELVINLAISIISFSVLIFLLVAVLMWRINADPSQVLRIFGILSILSFSTLLMVIGYSNEQLTPIIGLFGAVAGYLLGRDSSKDKQS
jgi:1,4-dihydroxy-2-naphthoate octaprenyltransferase